MSSSYAQARSSHATSWTSEVEAEPETETDQTLPGSNNLMMLHCLFAMVFAAATLGLLNCLGFVVRSSTCCPTGNGYSSCEIYQDLRSVLSFLLGAVLCCLLTKQDKVQAEAAEAYGAGCKAQFYTCLL